MYSIHRFDKSNPCPLCGGDHACSEKADGLIFCRRGRGQQPGFRRLGESRDGVWGLYRREGDDAGRPARPAPKSVSAPRASQKSKTIRPPEDWPAQYARLLLNHAADERAGWGLTRFAARLGVTPAALSDMGCVWRSEVLGSPQARRADPGILTHPWRDGRGETIGLCDRHPDGEKISWDGCHTGLIYSDDWAARPGPVLLVEGLSCTAAALVLGLCASGRPNNLGGVDHLAVLLADAAKAGRRIVVVGERDRKPNGDWPGRDGALRTARQLADRLGVAVEVVLPPGAAKDTRAWLVQQRPDLTDDGALGVLGLAYLAGMEPVEVCRPTAPKAAKPAPSRPGQGPTRRPEERCVRRRGAMMERLADRRLACWWMRCGRGSGPHACPGCLAYRKRIKREEADAAIDAAAKHYPTFHVSKISSKESEAYKKAAERAAHAAGHKAGGFTIWTPDGVIVVGTEAVAGSTPAGAAAAKKAVADALAAAEPRGKGRPMARAWGVWRLKKDKEEKCYRKLGAVRRTPHEVIDLCASLGVEVIDTIPIDSGVILRRLELIHAPELREVVIGAILSNSTVSGSAGTTVGLDSPRAGGPYAPFDLRRFDYDDDDYLRQSG